MTDTRTVQHGRTHINRQHSASECTLPRVHNVCCKDLANNPQYLALNKTDFLIILNVVTFNHRNTQQYKLRYNNNT